MITTNVETKSVAPSGAPLAGLGNPAPAGDGVHELIRERWSPRAFSGAPVSRESLNVLLEAARRAPAIERVGLWRPLGRTHATRRRTRAVIQ